MVKSGHLNDGSFKKPLSFYFHERIPLSLSFRVFSRLVRDFPNSFVPLLGMLKVKNSAFDGLLLALEEGMM